jgi:hypothetical protein
MAAAAKTMDLLQNGLMDNATKVGAKMFERSENIRYQI